MLKKNSLLLLVGNDCDYFAKHHLSIARHAKNNGFRVLTALPCQQKYIGKHINYPFYFSKTPSSPLDAIRTIISLTKIYRKAKPDIVHHFTIRISLLGGIAARLTRMKVVVNTISGLGYLFNQTKSESIINKLIKYCFRISLTGKNQLCIFFNNSDRDFFVKTNLVKKVNTGIVNGTGVDVQKFRPSPLPTGLPVVLLAARLVYAKGIAEFVEAARIINNNNRQAQFILAGKIEKNHPDAIPQSQIEKWQKNGWLEYWGYKKDMLRIYQKCNIVCLPSYYEGLPTSLLEAGACARPVIASDIPGIRCVVKNGVNGYLVPTKNSALLASAIQKLLKNKKISIKMGIAGRKIIEKKFDAYAIANEYFVLYKRLINRN